MQAADADESVVSGEGGNATGHGCYAIHSIWITDRMERKRTFALPATVPFRPYHLSSHHSFYPLARMILALLDG